MKEQKQSAFSVTLDKAIHPFIHQKWMKTLTGEVVLSWPISS